MKMSLLSGARCEHRISSGHFELEHTVEILLYYITNTAIITPSVMQSLISGSMIEGTRARRPSAVLPALRFAYELPLEWGLPSLCAKPGCQASTRPASTTTLHESKSGCWPHPQPCMNTSNTLHTMHSYTDAEKC
jgi:hypothetical protein